MARNEGNRGNNRAGQNNNRGNSNIPDMSNMRSEFIAQGGTLPDENTSSDESALMVHAYNGIQSGRLNEEGYRSLARMYIASQPDGVPTRMVGIVSANSLEELMPFREQIETFISAIGYSQGANEVSSVELLHDPEVMSATLSVMSKEEQDSAYHKIEELEEKKGVELENQTITAIDELERGMNKQSQHKEQEEPEMSQSTRQFKRNNERQEKKAAKTSVPSTAKQERLNKLEQAGVNFSELAQQVYDSANDLIETHTDIISLERDRETLEEVLSLRACIEKVVESSYELLTRMGIDPDSMGEPQEEEQEESDE